MSEPTTGQEPTNEPTEPIPGQEPVIEGPPAEAQSVDQLPKWAQKVIEDARKENAKHRKAKTAAEKAADEAARLQAEKQGEFKELYEKAQTELDQANVRVVAAEKAAIRLRVATKHKLPGALADRLQGETEAEMEADAQVLLDAMPKPSARQPDAGAGSNSTTPTPEPGDDEIRQQAIRSNVSFEAMKAALLESKWRK